MSAFKAVVMELDLTNEQIKDKQIQKFAIDYISRKASNNWVQYKNGNAIIEINKNDGTSIRTVLSDKEYLPEFPENIDLTISYRCNNNCKQCYMGCTKDGEEADILKFINDKNSFLYSLHEGTELAINGNEPLHKDLFKLLEFCKNRGIFANLTVHEGTLLKHRDILEKYLKEGYVCGIGVSPSAYSDEMIEFCKKYPTSVIHTIAGFTTMKQYEKLMGKNLKILILGYKDFGRGIEYASKHRENINKLINQLSKSIKDFTKYFKVVSFDNLAIEQLNPKSFLSEEDWQIFYRGDDGNHTMYIDLVNETFAKNSIQPKENHISIKNDVRDMLRIIRRGSEC